MTQLVIPMAGLGSRFTSQGFRVSKPFLPIGGYMMFEVVIANIWNEGLERIVLVSRQGAISASHISTMSRALGIPIYNLEVSKTTGGPACSVGLAAELLDEGKPLVIANSDQYLDEDFDGFHKSLTCENAEHQILVMNASDAKWSYVKLDTDEYVSEVREKRVISNLATVGIYGFANAASFLIGLQEMKNSNDRTNDEFYVAPVYNYLPGQTKTRVIQVGGFGTTMFGLGVPDDYRHFLKHGPVETAVRKTNKIFGY